ncbi:pyridoxamine 5'-phosphate oxidase family protein [Salinactinospora qingdaonensis]|uniref:Pyridoxamine 5'-phosphate oxidase family protein n=1 Tax=Salinactinospora qingdaonensis TaxID=702744 RepID=A0ABP7FX01_9ACTN
MTTWETFAAAAPDLAAAVRARFEAHTHHVLATLRKDGSPRVSGTEVTFKGADLTIGSMPEAVKAHDLQRDGRYALHANPGDADMSEGDAKISGRAVEVTDEAALEAAREPGQPAGPFHLFRMLIGDVVLTRVANDRLVIEHWRPGQEVRRTERT